MSTWYNAEIVTTRQEDEQAPVATRQAVEGEAAVVAAWLRAVADQIDPKRPVMREGARELWREAKA